MILTTCKKVVVDIKFGLDEPSPSEGLGESEGQRFLLNITAPKPSSKSKSSETLLSIASKVFNEVGIARKILVEAGINVNVFWKRRAIFSVFEENLPDKELS